MNLLDKLDALKMKTGDNNATLAKNAGIPATTIYGLYAKGYSNMKLSTLQSLCDYFGVSLDYLAKDDYSERTPSVHDGLCPDEAELITIYRELNAIGQQVLIGTARGLFANPDMKKDGASSRTTA